eukprot:17979-Heterococcus_DN1.PRE.2
MRCLQYRHRKLTGTYGSVLAGAAAALLGRRVTRQSCQAQSGKGHVELYLPVCLVFLLRHTSRPRLHRANYHKVNNAAA